MFGAIFWPPTHVMAEFLGIYVNWGGEGGMCSEILVGKFFWHLALVFNGGKKISKHGEKSSQFGWL